MRTPTLYSTLLSTLLSMVGLMATPGQVLAERYFSSQGEDSRNHRVDRPRTDRLRDHQRYGDYRRRSTPSHRPWRYTPRYRYNVKHRYKYPRHHKYSRYRHYYRGDDFWGWLAFTAITLAIIDNLNEQQQREHERTLHDALQAPVGETIYWKEQDASGSVTVTREGTSSAGRHCRKYSQQVKIGGESQKIYGTACRYPDGSWEIMD